MKEVTLSLKKVLQVFGLDIALRVERIYRLETANFTSGGFDKTLSPGMQVGGSQTVFPYGWNLLSSYWKLNSKYAPVGVVNMKDNYQPDERAGGNYIWFVKFPSVDAGMMTLGYLLSTGYPTQKWNSVDPLYDNKLSSIDATIVQDLYNQPNT